MLIEKLQKFDPERLVVRGDNSGGYESIDDILEETVISNFRDGNKFDDKKIKVVVIG